MAPNPRPRRGIRSREGVLPGPVAGRPWHVLSFDTAMPIFVSSPSLPGDNMIPLIWERREVVASE